MNFSSLMIVGSKKSKKDSRLILNLTFHYYSGLHEPKQKKRQKTGGSGFLAPLPLSNALVKFFGTGENALSRGAVVKRMWDYIKQNDLQVCHLPFLFRVLANFVAF